MKHLVKINIDLKKYLNHISKYQFKIKRLVLKTSNRHNDGMQSEYKLSEFSYIYVYIFLFEIVLCLILWKMSLKKIKDSITLILPNVIFIISSLLICLSAVSGSTDQQSNINTENYKTNLENKDHFTHTWAVHIPNGDNENLAHRIASEHGFNNLGKIFDDHYHFEHKLMAKRSISPSNTHQYRFGNDTRIRWSAQQKILRRKKRDFQRMIHPSIPKIFTLDDSVYFRDPKWSHMWYLNRGNGLDMNVIPAWKEGITGNGIVVTILDDGLETDHPDLEHNYDRKASYDVNSHDDDPMPHYDMTDSNRHGTRCAGEVAATANNSLCAVGIAFGAKVGGVRMLDGDVTDAVEARSLSLQPQHIDIYSASWGPDDDGKTVDGPGELASRAFIEGVSKGRKGKGSIFVWASGNGGRELDNCNCDGYTNSIWTLSISSATEEGHIPWYSEKCSSTLATTYSSGGQNEKQVVTTDLHHSCTISHTGTSASAPLAAGIVALVLEANTNLTWRDLQHIVVRTAKPNNLIDSTWSTNGVGRKVSHSFGYGLMDASAMVKLARKWKTVPDQQRCEINAPHVDKIIPAKSYITLQLSVKHCISVNFLEHVQAKITLTSQRRGDIQIYLISPAGTKVTLLTSRAHDVSRSGFNQWPFMSVHTWGETPHGNWQLEIHNEGKYMAQITQWDLIFYGTQNSPQPNDDIFGQFKVYSSDVDHNRLNHNVDSSSKQWRNTQQVGEIEGDIQQTVQNDVTSSACLNYLIDQRCVGCGFNSVMYNNRCFARCPEKKLIMLNLDNNFGFENSNSIRNSRNTVKHYHAIHDLCFNCDKTCLQCNISSSNVCMVYPANLPDIQECYSMRSGTLNDYSNITYIYKKNLYKFDLSREVIIKICIICIFIIIVLLISIFYYFGFNCKLNCCRGNIYHYDRIAFDVVKDSEDIIQDDIMR